MSAAAPQQSRREQQREETRERIFDAAIAEFLAEGFAKAQIPRIAAAAGVVRGTFYFHFPSKEHVLLELALRSQQEMARRLVEARLRGVPLVEALPMVADPVGVLGESEAGTDLMRDMLALFVRATETMFTRDDESSAVQEAVSEYLGEALDRGELKSDLPPDRLARTVLSSILGVIIAERGSEEERREEVRVLVRLLLRGMQPD